MRRFDTVAADNVASPLIVAAFKTLRDEIVVTAAAAEILPPTVKRFETVAADRVARPLTVNALLTPA